MQTRLVLAFWTLVCMLVSGCVMTTQFLAGPADDVFPIAETPPALPVSATQALQAAFGDRQLSLTCTMAAGDGGWRVACITAAGQRVLTLAVNALGELAVEASADVPKTFDPRRMVADIQFAFWPLDSLQQAARGTAWRVEQPLTATRRLYRRTQESERMVAEVHYADADPWNGRLWISNFEIGYSLYLVTRSGGPDDAP